MRVLEDTGEWARTAFEELGFETVSAESSNDPEFPVSGMISISGAWHGHVMIFAPAAFDVRTAVRYLGMAPSEIDEESATDAFMELVNTLGGHFKATLAGPCTLGLPGPIPANQSLNQMTKTLDHAAWRFSCDGVTIRVLVTEEASTS